MHLATSSDALANDSTGPKLQTPFRRRIEAHPVAPHAAGLRARREQFQGTSPGRDAHGLMSRGRPAIARHTESDVATEDSK